jgi:hypothetical protein
MSLNISEIQYSLSVGKPLSQPPVDIFLVGEITVVHIKHGIVEGGMIRVMVVVIMRTVVRLKITIVGTIIQRGISLNDSTNKRNNKYIEC